MLFRNYRDKVQRFYLTYKNAAFGENHEDLLIEMGLLTLSENNDDISPSPAKF
jgi:hypothetical protein